MEKSNHIEDQAMNHLLKNFVKQQKTPELSCEGFDPDLASLYLERVLTETETSRYEIHLFQCSPCRNSVVALARLIEQEAPLMVRGSLEEKQTIQASIEKEEPAIVEAQKGFAERLKAFFGVWATPKFALPAIAALVLAISIPVIISQNKKTPLNSSAKVSNDETAQANDNVRQIAQASPPQGGNAPVGTPPKESSATPASAEGDTARNRNNQTSGREGDAAGGTAGGLLPAGETSTKNVKEEAKSAGTEVGENRSRADESPARASEPPAPVTTTQPPPKSVASEKEKLGFIDPATTRRPAAGDKDATPTTLKPGNTGGDLARDNRAAGATIRPEDNQVQPPATSADSGRNTGLAAGKSLREEREMRKEKMRASASRKVHDKTFFLIDDFWTDQKYSKDKELPVVPVIKDSDVYKGLLEKYSGLQKFFTSFAANEKVIVVYKGTVYKLLPQDGK
jgi:hypothetical protein